MSDHIAYKCPFRIVPCPLGCGECLQEYVMQLHSQQQCIHHHIKCSDCCKLLAFSALDSHMLNVRYILCNVQFVMDFSTLAYNDYSPLVHFSPNISFQECPKRFFVCPQSCGKMLQVKDKAYHLENDCPRRIIACPLGCPVQHLIAEQFDDHKTRSCPKYV